MLIIHFFKASDSTFSRLHQRSLKSFKEAAISLRHLKKQILEGNLYLGPLEMSRAMGKCVFGVNFGILRFCDFHTGHFMKSKLVFV